MTYGQTASSPTAQPRPRGVSLNLCLTIACAVACGLLWGFKWAPTLAAHVGHDQAWDLYVADQMLHGVRLDGPTLIEVNPPFLVWFFSLPALLAGLLHISLPAAFRLFLIASITGLLAWSASLYRRVCRMSSLGVWLFLLCSMYIATGPVSLDDRGQREYFTAFLLLPYVLWVVSRLRKVAVGKVETFAIAAMAVIGVCLKPQHALDIVVLELLALIRLRSLRQWFSPFLIVVAIGPVLYLAAVRLFCPQYLHDIVPLLRETYWGFDKTWIAMAQAGRKQISAFVVVVLLYGATRKKLRSEAFVACLLAAATGALLAYAQQHKGWGYQLLALQMFSYIAFAVIVCDIAERIGTQTVAALRRPGERRGWTGLCVAVATLCFAVSLTLLYRRLPQVQYFESQKVELASIYSQYPRGTPVDLLAVEPWEWPEVLDQHKVWASRYMHLWMLPAIVRSQDPQDKEAAGHLSPDQIAQLSGILRRTTAEDLAHWQPLVVVVQPCGDPDICGTLQRLGYAGLLDWFERDPGFRDQWSHYRFDRSVGVMQVYTRTD